MMPDTLTDGTHGKVEFLRREIPRRVHGYFPDLSGKVTIEVMHKGRPFVRKHSILFEISVLDGARGAVKGMFVKIPKVASEKTVKGIYETLVDLYAFSTKLPPEMNTVRPLDCLAELPAIVTERVEGESLNYLLRNRRKAVVHCNILENCGRFLRAYHEGMGQITWDTDFSEEFWNQCLAYLKDLEDDGVGKEERLKILAGFEKGVSRVRQRVPTCLTVKDYQIRNIIVQENRTFFIDVTEPRKRTIYDNIATFLNSLTMLFWGTPWFFLGIVPPRILSDRFLEGYFANTIPLDLVSLFCAKSLCHRWHRALESLSVRKRGVTGIIGYIPLRHRINRFFHMQVMNHLQTALALPVVESALWQEQASRK